jgi:hypothetical protein
MHVHIYIHIPLTKLSLTIYVFININIHLFISLYTHGHICVWCMWYICTLTDSHFSWCPKSKEGNGNFEPICLWFQRLLLYFHYVNFSGNKQTNKISNARSQWLKVVENPGQNKSINKRIHLCMNEQDFGLGPQKSLVCSGRLAQGQLHAKRQGWVCSYYRFIV